MPELTGQDGPVEIAPGFTLEAPDLLGSVKEVDARKHVRGAKSGYQESGLMAAFDAAGMKTALMFEMKVAEDRSPTALGGRRRDSLHAATRQGEPAVILRAEASRANRDYALLHTDEAGVSNWIFPEDRSGKAKRGRELVFHLPRASADAPPGDAGDDRRGPISKLGRRVVRMLMWATDEIAGAGAKAFVAKWEKAKRGYGFFRADPGEFVGDEPDWDQLQQGRALLLLHGTTSKVQITYDGLLKDDDAYQRLHDYYGGRIFGFNHPTMSRSPGENIQKLFDLLPKGTRLDVDLVTHSRGGLVGRMLTERINDFKTGNKRVRVGKAIFVAGPNRGTILADGDNWVDLIDRYTNLLTNLPDNIYTLSLEGVLILVKVVGHGALAKLPGINSMAPGGDFLQRLNDAGDPRTPKHESAYYAICADFKPADANLLHQFGAMVADKFVDKLFGEENDGVVPTLGAYTIGPNAHGFPIPSKRLRVWSLQTKIHHINYFRQPAINEQIATWLTE